MIACLPMYDWPEIRAETDRLWSAIRDRLRAEGIACPDALDRSTDRNDAWQSHDLILGQTCGLPYRTRLHRKVSLVGTPDYGLPGAAPGYYFSVIVARADATDATDAPGALPDFRDRTLACNAYDSQSGWAAPQNHAAELGFGFSRTLVTGSHRDSAIAVSDGRADIAAIDAVTWRLMLTHMPDVTDRLRVIARTRPTPGLPLITSAANPPAPIARAVSEAFAALDPSERRALGITGFVRIPKAAYLAVPTPPPPVQNAASA